MGHMNRFSRPFRLFLFLFLAGPGLVAKPLFELAEPVASAIITVVFVQGLV